MQRIVTLLLVFSGVAGLVVALLFVAEKRVASEAGVPSKVFRRQLCDGVSVRRSGLYGVDLIQCGSCRIEKMKRGALTFGGFNELVLEDLVVVIPPAEPTTNAVAEAEAAAVTPRQILRELGVGDGFLSLRKMPLRFSGLRIDRLAVSRLEGTNVVVVFSAAKGVAKRKGLALTGCRIFAPGATNDVGKALLTVKPTLKLIWVKGSMDVLPNKESDNGGACTPPVDATSSSRRNKERPPFPLTRRGRRVHKGDAPAHEPNVLDDFGIGFAFWYTVSKRRKER